MYKFIKRLNLERKHVWTTISLKVILIYIYLRTLAVVNWQLEKNVHKRSVFRLKYIKINN